MIDNRSGASPLLVRLFVFFVLFGLLSNFFGVRNVIIGFLVVVLVIGYFYYKRKGGISE